MQPNVLVLVQLILECMGFPALADDDGLPNVWANSNLDYISRQIP